MSRIREGIQLVFQLIVKGSLQNIAVTESSSSSLQLISSVDPKFLKLTKVDDTIYTAFRETFKDMDIKLLHPDLLKSAEAKEVCVCTQGCGCWCVHVRGGVCAHIQGCVCVCIVHVRVCA